LKHRLETAEVRDAARVADRTVVQHVHFRKLQESAVLSTLAKDFGEPEEARQSLALRHKREIAGLHQVAD
jgi:hypothetical protein